MTAGPGCAPVPHPTDPARAAPLCHTPLIVPGLRPCPGCVCRLAVELRQKEALDLQLEEARAKLLSSEEDRDECEESLAKLRELNLMKDKELTDLKKQMEDERNTYLLNLRCVTAFACTRVQVCVLVHSHLRCALVRVRIRARFRARTLAF